MPTDVPGSWRGANPASKTLVRAEGLWFEDCGLIIQAENTLFRVSGDFLATRSPVFADMLSLPTPQDAGLMYGCMVVHLPDSAEDTTVFLKALTYSEFFEPFPAPTTFPILAGVLRMSHKYAVDVLRKRSLMHLSSAHPTTLPEWESAGVHFKSSWFDPEYCDYIRLVLLARQTSALWILPTVFYRMCRHAHRFEYEIISGDLQSRDKSMYIRAARFLESTATSNILDFLLSEVQRCTDDDCRASKQKMRRVAEGRRRFSPEDDLAFMPLEVWLEKDWDRLDVCQKCLLTMKKTHKEAKQSLWDRLPEIFELPDWKWLTPMREEALN
ncbi:hypothetical protein DFH09DRAFT_547975 [Mycena vulgaris]|nr:hypothetical protein DFH09DRAFT_547975 [Mycena vulgaris]